jgi:hypothetical protein
VFAPPLPVPPSKNIFSRLSFVEVEAFKFRFTPWPELCPRLVYAPELCFLFEMEWDGKNLIWHPSCLIRY